MTNDAILVPKEESKEPIPPPSTKSSLKKQKPVTSSVEKKLPAAEKEFPVDSWMMPPEQHGYIQGNEKDCL
jgi:hypothetical protein